MKVLHILALGLASASSAAAALCKPSPPAPSASTGSSSVSSVSSPSASPSTPAAPQPVCVVTNGYFDSGSLTSWTPTQFGGAVLSGGSGTCGQFSTCAQLDTVTGGYVTLSQTVPNTGVGLIDTFSLNYRAVATCRQMPSWSARSAAVSMVCRGRLLPPGTLWAARATL